MDGASTNIVTTRNPLVYIPGGNPCIQELPAGDVLAGAATGAAGANGADGAAATISVGTTTTGAAGTSASVTNSGSSSAAVFNFTIPRGDTGATGATGSPGGMIQLSQIVTASSQTTVDFTSISGSYSSLKILYFARDTASGTAASTIRLKFNNDGTAANYSATHRIGSAGTTGGTTINASVASSTKGVLCGSINNDGNTAGIFATGEITLVGYASTTPHKRMFAISDLEETTDGGVIQLMRARWASTAAVTRLTFGTDGTAFKDGSVFTLYGIP